MVMREGEVWLRRRQCSDHHKSPDLKTASGYLSPLLPAESLQVGHPERDRDGEPEHGKFAFEPQRVCS